MIRAVGAVAMLLAVTAALAGCAKTHVGFASVSSAPPAAASPASPAASALQSQCAPAPSPASITGWVEYSLTLTNPGTQPVQVTSVGVIFSSASGQEIGSDDPAQQDFPGVAVPVTRFSTVLIGAGQSVTVPMETDKISGAAGSWTCALGTWSS